MKRFKLAILLSHPIQYFSPLFRKLNEHPELDLTVYYGSKAGVDEAVVDEQFGVPVQWDIPLLEGYRSLFLKNHSLRPRLGTHFGGVVNWGLWGRFRLERPDALIVHGWTYASYVQGFVTAKALNIPVWLRLETPWNQERLKSGLGVRLKRVMVRHGMIRYAAQCLYIGKQNREFYRNSGVSEKKLIFTPYCVDNDRFRMTYRKLVGARQSFREEFGITPEDVVFLFAGKLITKKRIADLLEAFLKINAPHAHLMIVGDGELREPIKMKAGSEAGRRVHFAGFRNQSEIGKYYTLSDVFVLPSGRGETWGLVVNEAMNFNLPLIVSDLVGCAADLCRDGENGFQYPCGDIDTLAQKMRILYENPELRIQMGRFSAKLVSDYSYDAAVRGIVLSSRGLCHQTYGL